MAGEHFLFAEPDLAQIPAINAAYPGLQAPPVRLLPADLEPAEVAPLYRGGERVVLGQRELDLAAVVHDFAEHPLLMVFGDSKSGKTTLLRHLIRTIRENSTAADVAFTVFDRRLHLVDEPLFADNEYSANIDRVTPAVMGLAALVEQRRPPAGIARSRTGHLELPRPGRVGAHPLSDRRRCRSDPGRPGAERSVRRPPAVDTTARTALGGRRSRICGSSSPAGQAGRRTP